MAKELFNRKICNFSIHSMTRPGYFEVGLLRTHESLPSPGLHEEGFISSGGYCNGEPLGH